MVVSCFVATFFCCLSIKLLRDLLSFGPSGLSLSFRPLVTLFSLLPSLLRSSHVVLFNSLSYTRRSLSTSSWVQLTSGVLNNSSYICPAPALSLLLDSLVPSSTSLIPGVSLVSVILLWYKVPVFGLTYTMPTHVCSVVLLVLSSPSFHPLVVLRCSDLSALESILTS